MAGNSVNVNLEVSDSSGSLKKRNEEAKELNRNLSAAARNAEKALRPAARMQPQGEGTEYGRARGSMGTTGASARDFANQAQGLGGLVRVYATVAANLFAVSAAFNALKEAANTTSMIKGLDQLGAASGMALGSLSQRLVQTTDNAITLREAMTTVAKASSAGLDSRQILEIGQIAKTASLALGLDMTDAISRLTRGITKLEPELLDELGLFTKIGKATDDYARSVGKTAAGLTDFERRQAFANAVLKEGRDKFSELQGLDANPYQQLEASIRNLATAGLQLVNKVLVPIANVFSQNSVLLTAALGLIAMRLTKMAIPALTSWRDELVKSAQVAKAKARDITESFAEKSVGMTMAKFNLPELQKNLDDAKARYAQAAKKIAEIQQQAGFRQTKTTQNIAAGVYGEDPKDFARTQAQINSLSKQTTAEAKAYAEQLRIAKESQKEILKYTKDIGSAQNAAERQFAKTSLEEAARKSISQQAGARAERLDILSQVSGNVQAGGWKYAIYELNKGLEKAVDLKGWDKLRTRATGWAIAGATTAGVFMSALGNIAGYIAMAGLALAGLDALLSKNGRAVAEFQSAADALGKTVETSANVIKKFGQEITVASLAAKGTSFRELGNAVDDLTLKLERAIEKQSGWDSFKDFVKGLFNFDMASDFAESAAAGIAQQLKMIPEGPIRKELEAKVKAITKSAGATEGEIAAALKRMKFPEITKAVKETNKELEPARMGAQKLGDAGRRVEEALKDGNIRAQELFKTLATTDPIIRFGEGIVTIGIELREAFKDATSGAASLKKILDSSENARLISPENFKELLSLQEGYEKGGKAIQAYKDQIAETQDIVTDLQKSIARGGAGVQEVIQEKLKQQVKLEDLKIKVGLEESTFKALEQRIQEITTDTIRRGYEFISKQASLATERARVATEKGLLTGTASPGAVAAQTALSVKEIDLQIKQINIVSQLNDTMLRNNILMEQSLADKGITQIEERAKREGRELTPSEQLEIGSLFTKFTELGQLANAKKITPGLAQQMTTPEAARFGQQAVMGQVGEEEKRGVLEEQRRNVLIQGRVQLKAAEQAINMADMKQQQTLLGFESQRLDLSVSAYEYLSDAQIKERERLQTVKLQNDQRIAERAIYDEIELLEIKRGYASEETRAGLTKEIELKQKQLKQLGEQYTAEGSVLAIQQAQARITNEYAKQNKLAADNFMLQQQQRDMRMDAINNELELLGIRSQVQVMLPDEIANEEKRLRLNQLSTQYDTDIAKSRQERSDKLRAIQEKEDLAKKANQDYDRQYFIDQRAVIDSFYDNELERINRNNAAKQEGVRLQYSMTDRMKAYDQVFRNAFSGMADAIVDFAKTGKLSFKSMIDSMIEGLIRYELQQQALLAYKAFGGATGIMSFFANLVTGGAPTATPASSAPVPGGPGGYYPTYGGKAAKGAVYDGGILQFAKGGMFTNSIVTEPTLFKFARGTGLMGEAGPEAIMPLRRDSDGNLGVMAKPQGGNVEIVVNNYSGEKAETRETVDSRGNRKIEVVVGEMVANEVGRKNSPMQQAITGNFMTRPMITRR